MLTFIAQLPVGIILHDRHTVLVRQFHQLLAAFEAEGRASRVLKVREHVDKFRSNSKRGFQFIHDHAVLVRAYRDILRAIRIPRLQRTKICGRFHHNVITAIQKQTSDKIQCLL